MERGGRGSEGLFESAVEREERREEEEEKQYLRFKTRERVQTDEARRRRRSNIFD